MSAGGTKEVGRVSIRVVPNTDNFKKKTEEGLRHLRDMKMNLEPEFDKERVKREAKHAAENAKQKVPFEPDLDKSSLSGQARLASIWASRFKVRFRAVLDGKLAMIQAKQLADTLQDIANGKHLKFDSKALSLRSLMDVSGFTDGLDKAIGRMRAFRLEMRAMEWPKRKTSLDTHLGGSEKFAARMYRLRGTMKALKTAVGESAGVMLRSIKPLEAYKHSLKGFVSLGNILAGATSVFAAGMGLVSAATIGLSYVIGGVVDSTKVLSGSLLMLPGAAIMAGSAFATLRMGFNGFGEAAKAALDPSADLEAAIADLAPSAQASARALRGMAEPLQDIQNSVQEKMFDGWAPQIEAVGKRWLPVLETGLGRIADSTNHIGNEFFRWADTDRTVGAVNRMLGMTALTMRHLGDATRPALTGFTELGVAGMEAINDLTGGLPKLARRFERWAVSDKGQRQMREWIDGSIEGFQDLWGATSKFAGAMAEVGRAFGVSFNGDALSRLNETMDKFQNWLGSADDADSRISKFAASAEELAAPWLDAAGRIIDALRPVFDEFSDFSAKLSGEMADQVSSVVETMAPAFESLFGFLNDHSDVFVPLISGLVGLRVGIGIFGLLRKAVAPFVGLATGTAGAVGKLTGKTKKAGDAAKASGKAAKKGGHGWVLFGRGAKEGTEEAGKAVAKSKGKLKGFGKTFGKGAKAVGKGAKVAGKGLLRMVPGLSAALWAADIGGLLYNHWEPFRKTVDGIANSKFGQKIGEGWNRAKQSFSDIPKRLAEGRENAKRTFKQIPDNVKRVGKNVSDRWNEATKPLSDWGKRTKQKIEEDFAKRNTKMAGGGLPKISDLKQKAAGIKSAVSDAFSGMEDALSGAWDSVKTSWGSAWDGIGDYLTTKWDSLKEAASSTWSTAKETVANAWEGVQELWGSTWTGIGDFLGTTWESIKTRGSETWTSARELAMNAWEGVQEHWSAGWTGIKDGLSEVWTGIQETATSVWDRAKEVTGTVWDGVQGGWEGVWSGLSGFLTGTWTGIQDTATTTWTGAQELVSTVWDGVSENWTGTWQGVQETLSSVWSSIKDGASSAFDGVASDVSGAWDSVSSATSSAWDAVVSTVTSAASSAVEAASSMGSSIAETVSSMGSSIVEAISSAISSFVQTISSGFSQAVSMAASLPGQVVGAMGNLGGLLVASGRSLVQGFVNGIRSMIGAVTSAASAVVSAARAFFPFSPAKKGPFSGKGYTTYSGKALAKDFAGGMRSEIKSVQDAATAVTKAANAPFDKYHHDQVLNPVLESNAEKIADARKREAEAEEEHLKRLADIDKDYAKRTGEIDSNKSKDAKKGEQRAKAAAQNNEKIAKENERYAEKIADIRKSLDESLEAPDYTEIERSFSGFYVEGARGILEQQLQSLVRSEKLVPKAKAAALNAVKEMRSVVGDHPVLAKVEANVKSEHFEYSFNKAIEESKISAVPVEFVISNLEQLKSDLGMGDGVVSRAIDQAVHWNWNDTDAKRWREEGKQEIHYHVEDMQEAIRRENLRARKQMMKMK